MATTDKRLTQVQLKKFLSYDPETGIFTRVSVPSPIAAWRIGQIAGHIGTRGYRTIGFSKTWYFAHRLAWLYMTGKWPRGDLDHRDGNRDNNRWENLRPATNSQNKANCPPYLNNRSGFKGVHFVLGGKWRAKISVNGVKYHLGYYVKLEDAAEAYRIAALKHFGKFARFE